MFNNLLIATKNKGKVAEFKQLFNKYGIQVKSLLELEEEIEDIEETGTTFKENAALKAEQIAQLLNCPVIADDSGLIIDALDGEPGVYSARYSGENATDKANNEKVLHKLKHLPARERTARFISVLALAMPNEKTIFTEGRCEGFIAHEPNGDNGFGYDPIFIANGHSVTLAQLTSEEKNKISHRYHALKKLENVIIEKKESV